MAAPDDIEEASGTSPDPDDPTVTSSRLLDSDETTSPRPDQARTLERGTLVGRYTVIEEIGAGGMGVVYMAYDPELDRSIALKFLLAARPDDDDDDLGGARLLREAKAIAQVSHPNVVAVYDVDTYAGDIYVAMEYVEGVPVNEWIRQQPRSRDEILDAFVQAGEGLEAAHGRGVIHRDFKPHNVLVGADGRVRVLDFGLAYTGNEPPDESGSSSPPADPMDRLTATGVVMGTPAYMSPEQHANRPTDARSDQFSFCMSLCEALTGERPQVIQGSPGLPGKARRDLPRWLAAALERGLSENPEGRFPTMRQLLETIRRGRGRRRRRRLAAGGIAGALVLAGALWGLRPVAEEPCANAGNRADTVWNQRVRAALQGSFSRSGLAYANISARTVVEGLDHYHAGWRAERRDACEATHVRHEQSDELLDQRMQCLDRQLEHFSAVVAQLEVASPDVVARGVQAVDSLAPADACGDPEQLEDAATLPTDRTTRSQVAEIGRELAAARAARSIGNNRDTKDRLARLLERARATRHARTEAAVSSELGLTLADLDIDEEAQQKLERAYFDAIGAGDRHLALVASARAVEIYARQGRYADAEEWAKHVRALERGTRDDDDRARALEALGHLEHQRGQLVEARTLLESAVALRRRQGSPTALARALVALGRVHASEQSPAQKQFYDEASKLLAAALGANHPATLEVDIARGTRPAIQHALEVDDRNNVLSPRQRIAALEQLARLELNGDRFARAAPRLVEAASLATQRLGPHSSELGDLYKLTALGFARRGEFETSIEFLRLAIEQYENALGPNHPKVARSLNNMGMDTSYLQRKEEALVIFEKAMSIINQHSGGRHPLRGDLLNNMAMVHGNRGDLDKEIELYLESAKARALGLGENHPKVGDSYTNIGSVLRGQGKLDEAERYQRKALRIYETAYASHKATYGNEHRDLGWPLTDLGHIAIDRGKPAEGIPYLERAVALRLATGAGARFLGQSQFYLAIALWESKVDRARAMTLAREAEATFRRGHTANEKRWLDDLHAWLRSIGKR